MKTRFSILFALLCCLTLASFGYLQSVASQTQVPNCTDLSGHTARYANGANVCVTRGAGFTDTQWSGVAVGLENWNQTLFQQGHLTNFDYSHTGACPSNGPTLTLERGPTTCASGQPDCVATITKTTNSAGTLQSATIRFDNSRVDSTGAPVVSSALGHQKLTQHEVGHALGFGDAIVNDAQPNTNGNCSGGQVSGSTVMNRPCGGDDSGNNLPTQITPCDAERLNTSFTVNGAGPWPTPTPQTCPQNCSDVNAFPPQICVGGVDYCRYNSGCEDPWEPMGKCCCTSQTPIIVDVLGNGIDLTNPLDGVTFDINADGQRDPLSWTRQDSDDAWLFLDRNKNAVVDDGLELFGNVAPQSKPPKGVQRNGFRALAEYDRPEQGGNADGLLDKRDSIFTSLRLWQDLNHNGVSEAGELKSLSEVGLLSFALNYRESARIDQNGNRFKWRTKITTTGKRGDPWAWDVLLASPLLKP